MINIFKEQKGITLITLIITVVLLIIITATIAINSHTSLELSNLTKLENDIQALNDRIATYYVKNGTLPVTSDTYTKKELSSRITNLSPNDGDTYYRIDLSKLDNITLNYGNNTYIINETSHNIYNLDSVVYDEKVYYTVGNDEEMISVIDHEYFTQEQISNMIGKYVDYTPDQGTYSLITNSAEYAGTADNTSDFTTENFGWRIWEIDGNTLTLIADDVTSTGGTGNGTLKLYGPVGYNNGVKILNDICKNCYSNSSLGAIGKSFNVDDIENVLDRSVWKPEDYYYSVIDGKKYNTYIGRYGSKTNTYYPYIWQFEEYTKIENDNKTIDNKNGQGLSKSEQQDYYTKQSYTNLKADKYIEGTETYWKKDIIDLSTNNFINSAYYYMILDQGSTNTDLGRYWLASRYTLIAYTDSIYFGIFCFTTDKISGTGLYDCFGLYDVRNPSAVRPMVEINLSQVSIDTTTTTGANAANAYKLVKK